MVTLEDARRVIAAAEAKAKEIGQPMNIAVADGGANQIAHVRMDGAWLGSIDISINKAFTARAFDISTKELAQPSQPGQQFFGIQLADHGRVMIFAAGFRSSAMARWSAPSASAAAPAIRIKPSPKRARPRSERVRERRGVMRRRCESGALDGAQYLDVLQRAPATGAAFCAGAREAASASGRSGFALCAMRFLRLPSDGRA